MGQGSRLQITNVTALTWSLSKLDQFQMELKTFPATIGPFSTSTVYVEFLEPLLTPGVRGHFVATYDAAAGSFDVRGRWNFDDDDDEPRMLWIDTGRLLGGAWLTTPPRKADTGIVALPWLHDGIVPFALAQQQQRADVEPVGELAQALPSPWRARWMQLTAPVIGKLTPASLCWPGCHNAGTCKMERAVSGPWARCQSETIRGLLDAGARCLDLRVGVTSAGVLQLVHGGWFTTTSLLSCIAQVRDFCAANAHELVMLDLHQCERVDGRRVEHESVLAAIREQLGDLLIPAADHALPLSDLWTKRGRVLLPSDRIPQLWREANATADQLEYFLNTAQPPGDRFWAVMVALAAQVTRAVPHMTDEVNRWFAPCSKLLAKACIVHVDFIGETALVDNCISESLRRAAVV
jgi:hypothetical protein